jgi:hypothetical protein
MPIGTLISRLDDFELTQTAQALLSPAERKKAWDAFLLSDAANKQERVGWCIPRTTWESQSTSCCDVLDKNSQDDTGNANQDQLCFQALFVSVTSPGRCYNPIRLVSKKMEKQRCSKECPEEEICIAPDKREQLIRIQVTRPDQESSRVVLFQGSPISVYSALTVTPYRFRLGWIDLPYYVFQWWNLFVSYLLNLSLAMALLNMLPLPSLDGDVYLRFLLAILVSRFHKDAYEAADEIADEEEVISGIQLSDISRVTSRPLSPTQQRRPSAPPRLATVPRQRQSSTNRMIQHSSNARIQAKIQERLRWFTIGLAVFVFGGSIILHAVKQS